MSEQKEYIVNRLMDVSKDPDTVKVVEVAGLLVGAAGEIKRLRTELRHTRLAPPMPVQIREEDSNFTV